MRKILSLGLVLAALVMVVGAVAPAQIDLFNRSASGEIVDDAHGVLIMRGIGPYGQFFNLDSEGRMTFDLNDIKQAPYAPYAEGLNPDGTYKFTEVFAIQNSGPEAYNLKITSDSARVKFWLDGTGQWWGNVDPTQTLIKGPLASGSTLEIGLYIDATGLGDNDLISAHITIEADNP